MALAFPNTISLFNEMVAYEILMAKQNETVKTISEKFKQFNELPSKLLERYTDLLETELRQEINEYLKLITQKCKFSVCINGDFQYPSRLREARYPLELFYYRGDIGLLDSRCISVVGSRESTEEGIKRARKLVRGLVDNKFTIVSGLATGIDTAAMQTAIENKGKTIGVIGTPINRSYPKENEQLQAIVAEKYLLMSQVPFFRYENEPFKSKKFYFPQRNETMSAISEATVIVEASDTSGTLTQARACFEQGRKLFILKSIVNNSNLSWPKKYIERGAFVVSNLEDILKQLS